MIPFLAWNKVFLFVSAVAAFFAATLAEFDATAVIVSAIGVLGVWVGKRAGDRTVKQENRVNTLWDRISALEDENSALRKRLARHEIQSAKTQAWATRAAAHLDPTWLIQNPPPDAVPWGED